MITAIIISVGLYYSTILLNNYNKNVQRYIRQSKRKP